MTVLSLWRGEVNPVQKGRYGFRQENDVPYITPMDIIEAIARDHGYSRDELIAPSRVRPLAHARQAAMYALRSRTHANGEPRFSYPQIGRLFGTDHGTVYYSCRRHADRNNLPRLGT